MPYISDERYLREELRPWQQRMQRAPSLFDRLTHHVQARLNGLLPERVHQLITSTVRHMVQGVLAGSGLVTRRPLADVPFAEREATAEARIRGFRLAATAEGAATGAGGFLLGLADFPLLLGLKLKLLFELAAIYGYDARDYTERLYVLHVLQLAFSSQHTRNLTYQRLAHWPEYRATLPPDETAFDWRTFQQEYRDYLDLAKLAQLLPVVGAPVGAIANYRLLKQLGRTAMNCYRLRHLTELAAETASPRRL
jgi:hypothetical protein